MGMSLADYEILRERAASGRASRAQPKPPTKPLHLLSEAQEQQLLCVWLSAHPVLRGYWLHIPNERINKIERIKLKAQGVMPGAPDIIAIRPTLDGRVGVVVELKRSDRRSATDPEHGASEAQRIWLESFRRCGWAAYVCYGAAEAIARLRVHYG